MAQLVFFAVQGQGEATNWYFGNGAGIQFNNDGSVTALTDGLLNTVEGCASISDADGNLLFYTDGITVYDRTHGIMQNGTGLYGDPSSTQAAIIVPKPEDPNIQYIFTVDTAISREDIDRGLSYSVIDLSLNAGNGAVIQKNIKLLDDCSEKITAVVKNCFDQSIWVVTLASENGLPDQPFNTYHAFEVNTTGVQKTSVKTTFEDLEINDPRGYLKFSADGSKLVSANSGSGLFIYDFDPDTGLITNQETITISSSDQFAYGVEFSPNQQFIYILASNNQAPGETNNHKASLLQYDITSTDISATEVILDIRNLYRGALQLGENGKIYRTIASDYFSGSPYLGVINNPNEKGTASNYVHNAIFLEGRNGTQGLPPFIQSFFDKIDLVKNTDGTKSSLIEICVNQPFNLEADFIPGAVYKWEKDGIPFTNSSNTFEIPSATLDDTGRYRLEIILPNPDECTIIGESTIHINPLPPTETLSLIQCDLDSDTNDGLTAFNLNELSLNSEFNYTFYESISDMNSDLPITDNTNFLNTNPFNETIYYRVSNSAGCTDVGQLELEVQSINLSTSAPYIFETCDEDINDSVLDGFFNLDEIRPFVNTVLDVRFYASIDDARIEVNSLMGTIRTESTTLYARIENEGLCEDVVKVELLVNPKPFIDFDSTFLWCTDATAMELIAPSGFDSYRWLKQEAGVNNEVSTNQNVFIASIGNYILEVGYSYDTSAGTLLCTSEKVFTIAPSNIAVIEDVVIEDVSDNNLVKVLVTGDGLYEYSLDGETYQDSNLFENVLPGFATLYVRDKNGCGITDKIISVVGYPKFFTPNNDGVNDFWQVKGINGQFQNGSLISVYDRYGKILAQISPTDKGWDGSYNGKALPSTNYWFKVILEDGRVFQGPFALKR